MRFNVTSKQTKSIKNRKIDKNKETKQKDLNSK